MSGPHFVELVLESGELHRRFRCEAPADADCRRRPPGDRYDAESYTAEEATEPGHECWAAEWVDAVGIEDAIVGASDDTVLASVPVLVSYEEGVGIAPIAASGSGRTRLYVAGPMTGYLDFNYPAFHAAEQRLRDAGYDVLNPAHTENENTTGAPQTWDWYMRRALALLLQADGIALLDGWEESRGAVLEVHVAIALGMARKGVNAWADEGSEAEQ